MRVRVPGEGAAGPRGGPSGDLYLLITVRPHEELQRRGMTIVYECPITFSQAALGDTIEVPTVDGPMAMVVKPGSQYGQQVRIPGKGAPDPRTGRAAIRWCGLRVVVPTRLTERERAVAAGIIASRWQTPPGPQGILRESEGRHRTVAADQVWRRG